MDLIGHELLVIQVDTGEWSDAFGTSEFANHTRDVLLFDVAPREHVLKDRLVYRADAGAQANFNEPAWRVREQYVNVHSNVGMLVRVR